MLWLSRALIYDPLLDRQDEANVQVSPKAKLAYEQGVEVGLTTAIEVLEGLAGVMLDRESEPGRRPNYARRVRIKAYQVASKRLQTQLARQRRLVAKLEMPEDQLQAEHKLRAKLDDLAL